MARGNSVASVNYLKVTPSGAINRLSDEFTISFWIKNNDVTSTSYVIDRAGSTVFSIWASTTGNVYGLLISTEIVVGGPVTGTTLVDFVMSVWYHVVITYDSVVGHKFHVNGSEVGSSSGNPDSMILGSGDLYILTDQAAANQSTLDLAEMGIWNRVIDPTEINGLYAKKWSPRLIPNGLVAAWPLEGLASPEPDVSGCDNHLSLFGAVPVTSPEDILTEFDMNLSSPHITTPIDGEQHNRGTVDISWLISDPTLSLQDPDPDETTTTDSFTHEIEYTDKYQENGSTVWRTLKRRIPWSDKSYQWVVGKTIKSSQVRIRMRTKDSKTESVSDWSMSDTFAVNVFDLITPSISSPIPGKVYAGFVLIILDETIIKNTYNQKVRYTLEYSSESLEIDWTIIAANIPVGQNVIRWDIETLTPANDYVLRLTAQGSSRDPQTTNSLFSFTAVADQRSESVRFSSLCTAINTQLAGPGEFMINVGDEDPIPANRTVIDTNFGENFVWYPVIGNHEAETPTDMAWLRNEYHNANGTVRTPLKNLTNQDGPETTKETNYTFDHGNAHFVIMNQYWNGSSDIGTDGDVVPDLLTWLSEDLAQNTKPIVFVFGHEPAFPFNRHIGDSLDKYPTNRDAFWAV
ncbi:MAG: metallophosphoesterase, partial [Kiritimatiellae bacterium]|nr:metallophosphoesterase [Kiritimatiellia bacterium]